MHNNVRIGTHTKSHARSRTYNRIHTRTYKLAHACTRSRTITLTHACAQASGNAHDITSFVVHFVTIPQSSSVMRLLHVKQFKPSEIIGCEDLIICIQESVPFSKYCFHLIHFTQILIMTAILYAILNSSYSPYSIICPRFSSCPDHTNYR